MDNSHLRPRTPGLRAASRLPTCYLMDTGKVLREDRAVQSRVQSTVIALAELLGPLPGQGLRRSQTLLLAAAPAPGPPPLLPD